MSARVLFDLALNAALAFVFSAGIVLLLSRATRRWHGAWHVALLVLPFAKAFLEIARGVPAGSFFWAFSRGARHDLGSFQLGFGIGPGRVNLVGALSTSSGGIAYPTSLPELLARGASLNGLGWLVDALGAAALVVALALASRRVLGAAWFERRRRRERAHLEALETARVGRRSVDVYVSDVFAGSPFAGGLWRPYVCIPRASHEALSGAERSAVVAHELAHIRRLDVVWSTLLALAADLLWFCPGVRTLARHIADGIERAADERAVRDGTSGAVLASAVVRIAERAREAGSPGFVTSFGSPARERVTRLLSPVAPVTWRGWLSRVAIWAVVANSIAFAVFFGNHG